MEATKKVNKVTVVRQRMHNNNDLRKKVRITRLHWINPKTGRAVSYWRALYLGIIGKKDEEVGIIDKRTHKFYHLTTAKAKGLLKPEYLKKQAA